MPLAPDEAKSFYDRFGAKQDLQFYENRAVDRLIELGRFPDAESVFELGCGTGRVAERLLKMHLTSSCRYLGQDVSATMVELTERRLSPWCERVTVRLTEQSARLPDEADSFDRYVSTYVFDLLSEPTIEETLAEAWRVLRPGGLLCHAGLTSGDGAAAKLVAQTWKRLAETHPQWVGGCRPIHLADYLDPERWLIEHDETVTVAAVSSEVLVAKKTNRTMGVPPV